MVANNSITFHTGTMSIAEPVSPEPSEEKVAQTALRALSDLASDAGPVRLQVGDGGEIVIPRSALTGLTQILATFAHGEGVTVLPTQAELTTQQAADALRVSRPYLIGLLDTGEIDYRTVGTHRRIRASSLIAYMRTDADRRRAAADALSAETYDLGLA